MKTFRIAYTYECWKCPARHDATYTVDAMTMDSAVAAWRADMVADFDTTHDYDLLVVDIREIEREKNEVSS